MMLFFLLERAVRYRVALPETVLEHITWYGYYIPLAVIPSMFLLTCLAVERVGMPEARILLAQAAIYVACAPKSNASYMAIGKALENVQQVKTSVPGHLKNIHANGEGDVPQAVGYKYAHDYPNHYVRQQYLPDEIINERFYEPTDIGYEKTISEHLRFLKDMEENDG